MSFEKLTFIGHVLLDFQLQKNHHNGWLHTLPICYSGRMSPKELAISKGFWYARLSYQLRHFNSYCFIQQFILRMSSQLSLPFS